MPGIPLLEEVTLCGYTIKFYKAGSILPNNFISEYDIDPDWQISVQHGKDYKDMIELIQESLNLNVEITKQDKASKRTPSGDGQPFAKNPYIYMFFTPCKQGEQFKLPTQDDYVVFHIKKGHTLKASRLFQCHCQRSKPSKSSLSGNRNNIKITQRTKQDIPSEFSTLAKMIEANMFEGIPISYFSACEDTDCSQSEEEGACAVQKGVHCLKLFKSLNKYHSHQRTHTKEQPFLCKVPGCSAKFNQKGNLITHLRQMHQVYDHII